MQKTGIRHSNRARSMGVSARTPKIGPLFALALLALNCSLAWAQSRFARSEVIDGEYIILSAPDSSLPNQAQASKQEPSYHVIGESTFATLVRPASRTSQFHSSQSDFRAVPFDSERAARECAEIQTDPRVRHCEPNFVKYYSETVPNDPLFFPHQFYHFSQFAEGTNVFDLRSIQAWDKSTGSDNVIIGIIDSGINYQHPDLSPNLWINPGETFGDGKDNDGNGFVDDIIGIDATNLTNDPFDCNGHGSHVAGIIGARGNNGGGIAGVAWNVRLIMARNAIDCGPSVSTMSVVRALDYFYDLKLKRGIQITAINGSYGGPNATQAEFEALARLAQVNIVFVAAAGNGGEDGIGDNLDFEPAFPAAYPLDNILSIANLDTTLFPNALNSSSNFGVQSVDIAAPGTEILSTVNQGDGDPFFGPPGVADYNFKTGTSMAAPIVTGSLALLAAQRPGYLSFRRQIDAVMASRDAVAALQGRVKSGGTLNLFNLLSAAEPSDQCPGDPQKLDAGACGCGVPENFSDSDSDGALDCGDACPNDSQKTSPGICGCGLSDSDADGDGLLSCQDQCPNDSQKSSAGACGCGTPDIDANANGQLDCFDVSISNFAPPPPRLERRKSKYFIALTGSGMPGERFFVQFETTRRVNGRKRTLVRNVQTQSTRVALKNFKSGDAILVKYVAFIPGPTPLTSQPSAVLRLRVR